MPLSSRSLQATVTGEMAHCGIDYSQSRDSVGWWEAVIHSLPFVGRVVRSSPCQRCRKILRWSASQHADLTSVRGLFTVGIFYKPGDSGKRRLID